MYWPRAGELSPRLQPASSLAELFAMPTSLPRRSTPKSVAVALLANRTTAARLVPFVVAAALTVTTLSIGSCRTAEPRVDPEVRLTLDQAMALLENRPRWERHNRLVELARHPAEKHLADWVIVLDPGHGGMADESGYKRGPTGVREAEMNLRVAKLLRELLEQAGATVLLTREGEISEAANDRLPDTHARRAAIANSAPRPDGGTGADLFISIHHNASSRPTANYTSVWFHGEAAWSEPALDAARTIGHRLGARLRTQVALTSLLMSDFQMYGSGFAVLRHAEVPAILLESSFFTHPEEEQRLLDARYNLREAYAIYEGLCELAYGGRPTQTPPAPLAQENQGDPAAAPLRTTETIFVTTLDDGLPEDWWGSDRNRILPSTVTVTIDGRRVSHNLDPATQQLTFAVRNSLAEGEPAPVVTIHHANFYKQHNFPQRYLLSRTGEAWSATSLGSPRAD